MRAKEYIEINKGKFEFAEQITAILHHCADLRADLSKTIKFFDCYLSTFENLQRFLTNSCVPKIKKESFWKLLREELQSAIKADKSYTYLYQRLLQEKDMLNNLVPTDEIKECICRQFEDYPKTTIDDFLNTETNQQYFESIKDEFAKSDDILNVFNTACEIFDTVRVQMCTPVQASYYFKEYNYQSDRHKCFILPLVAEYLNSYDYDLTAAQVKNKQKVSEELSKYIAKSINPQSEIVKAKSYWHFFQNTLKITVTDKEKLALLINKQTEFNQMPECERQIYGANFGHNCQLEIDKIRQLQALNINADEETTNEKQETKRTLKVTTDVLIAILKKAGFTANSDNTKLARLISYLTDFSEEKIRQRFTYTDELTSYHKAEVEAINKILADINANISIEYNKQR
ncbi:MAG: hypothetical protein LBN27_07045 [Prevotellaceae bacterium]|jgi:hypothetical protein|nr:hypothetical protein [Prevotellaceae bacterium]